MSPESRSNPLNQSIARMLVEPEHETVPLGVDDVVSSRIYEPMTEIGSAELIMELIDYTGSRIVEPQIDNTDSEFNQLKIDRLVALVKDMPGSLPIEERTRAWHKLLGSDWLHASGEPSYGLEHAIAVASDRDSQLGEEIKKVKKSVIQEKLAIVEKAVAGDSRIPSFRGRSISFNEGMDIYNLIRQNYPDGLSAYHTLMVLSIADCDNEGMALIAADQ